MILVKKFYSAGRSRSIKLRSEYVIFSYGRIVKSSLVHLLLKYKFRLKYICYLCLLEPPEIKDKGSTNGPCMHLLGGATPPPFP